jgi:glycosyltransferase involved in cell wall biosynthesis
MNGVVVSIQTFKKALEERGHEVLVFAPDNDEAKACDDVYRFPAIKISKKLYPVIFPSLDIQKTYLPEEVMPTLDIIHAQHMFTAGAMAKYAAEKYKKPLVYTYHTLITEYANKYAFFMAPLVRNYLKNMSVKYCNGVDTVVTPSDVMKKILVQFGVTAPIEVIMTGIDPSQYKRQNRVEFKKKYSIAPEDKILLYVGRLAPEKNIPFLLQAFKKIQKEYSKCHLVLVGGGPEEEQLKKMVSSWDIARKITFTGMLPKGETNAIFGMGDIFSYPSPTETQGIVVAEAMAAGTVPVAVNKMGPTDLIHDGKDGYLTKLTLKDFTEKILKLLKDEDLHNKFANAGLERIDEFSTKTSTDKLEVLYKNLIAKQSE